jgi:hypothetical protein
MFLSPVGAEYYSIATRICNNANAVLIDFFRKTTFVYSFALMQKNEKIKAGPMPPAVPYSYREAWPTPPPVW